MCSQFFSLHRNFSPSFLLSCKDVLFALTYNAFIGNVLKDHMNMFMLRPKVVKKNFKMQKNKLYYVYWELIYLIFIKNNKFCRFRTMPFYPSIYICYILAELLPHWSNFYFWPGDSLWKKRRRRTIPWWLL